MGKKIEKKKNIEKIYIYWAPLGPHYRFPISVLENGSVFIVDINLINRKAMNIEIEVKMFYEYCAFLCKCFDKKKKILPNGIENHEIY